MQQSSLVVTTTIVKKIRPTVAMFSVGRSLRSTIVISKPKRRISRTHCIFKKRGGEWNVFDRSSRGTWLNDRRIYKLRSHKVKTGDVLQLGENVTLALEISSDNNNTTHQQQMSLRVEDVVTISDSANDITETTAATVQQPPYSEVCDQLALKQTPVEEANLVECIFDDELKCFLCREMFIGAVTLPCSHSFCKYCITNWKKLHSVCPICKTEITAEFELQVHQRLIEKILEKSNKELRDHRWETIMTRQFQELFPAEFASASTLSAPLPVASSTSDVSCGKQQSKFPTLLTSSEDDSS